MNTTGGGVMSDEVIYKLLYKIQTDINELKRRVPIPTEAEQQARAFERGNDLARETWAKLNAKEVSDE